MALRNFAKVRLQHYDLSDLSAGTQVKIQMQSARKMMERELQARVSWVSSEERWEGSWIVVGSPTIFPTATSTASFLTTAQSGLTEHLMTSDHIGRLVVSNEFRWFIIEDISSTDEHCSKDCSNPLYSEL